MASDADFLQAVLTDANGGWVSHSLILGRAQYQLGHGLTVHSRASDLRSKRGLDVECKVETVNGRKASFYRLSPGDAARPHSPRPDTANGGVSAPGESLFTTPKGAYSE